MDTTPASVAVTSSMELDNGGVHYDAARYITLIVGFCILVIGVAGNVTSFIVLQTASFRTLSFGFLLSALAVLDTLSLLSGLFRKWILMLPAGYDIRAASTASCKTLTFLLYASQVCGSWTLGLFTLDRTISVLLPARTSRQWFNRRRVIIAWSIAICLIGIFYAQIFFTFSLNEYNVPPNGVITECNFDVIYFINNYSRVFYWIDVTLFSGIPTIVIIICNMLVVARLVRMKREARQLTAPSSEDGNRYRSTIAMLMVVSLVFVATTLPYGLYFSTHSYVTKETPDDYAVTHLVGTCFSLLYYCNNAVNFLLYCLSAERFRDATKNLGATCRAWWSSKQDPKDIAMADVSVSATHDTKMNFDSV